MANVTKKINLVRKRGDTRSHVFVVLNAVTDVVEHIGTWTSFVLAVNTLKAPPDNTTEVLKITGVLTTDGSDGEIGFSPPGTAVPGNYYYDAQCLDGNGEKFTIAEGRYKITQDIAKD